MRLIALIIFLIVIFAINIFSVHFGAEDSRGHVRVASVASGMLASVCIIAIPGASLLYLLSSNATDALLLIKLFTYGAAAFTCISLTSSIAIAIRLHRSVA